LATSTDHKAACRVGLSTPILPCPSLLR